MFGAVISGLKFVREIENTPTGAQDKPLEDVVIVDSGVLDAKAISELVEDVSEGTLGGDEDGDSDDSSDAAMDAK